LDNNQSGLFHVGLYYNASSVRCNLQILHMTAVAANNLGLDPIPHITHVNGGKDRGVRMASDSNKAIFQG
jgi:hypothetical protein